MIGLAVGDALGAAVEFSQPGEFEPVTGYRDGSPHPISAGEWTDDTSMALALADSIGAVGWDINDQAERYLTWWSTGKYSVNGRVFDIGGTTVRALQRFWRQRDARSSGDTSSSASGNGSIMRLAPVAVAYMGLFPDRLDALTEKLAESSLPTHASRPCLSACVYLGTVLCGLLQGAPRDEVLSPHWPPFARITQDYPLHDEVEVVRLGSFRHKQPPQIRGSGYVVHSLEAALWAFHDARDFREAVLRAVNLGNDADTTAAVCGQLAGAYWGESGIPQTWRDGLARKDLIEPILERLVAASSNNDGI